MISLIFSLFTLFFIFFWWIATKKKRKSQIRKSQPLVTRTTITSPPDKPSESLSDFQQWILNYAQVDSAEELEESLKIAFQKNDWTLLDPLVYRKWSKFKYGF